VIFIPRNRSGSSWVEPWTGANTDMPKRKESAAAKLPAANFSVSTVASGLTVKVMSPAETPLAGPTWNRFGFWLQTRPVDLVSNATEATAWVANGCTARPK